MTALAALALALAPASAARVDAVARQAGLAGEVLVARGDTVLLDRGYGPVDPRGGAKHRPGARWRLASITKQVTATLLLRDFAGQLDTPLAPALHEPTLGSATLRELLTHHSGLANPGDAPAFYQASQPDYRFCLSRPAAPTERFAYNNCDYLVAAMLLGGRTVWPAGMSMADRGAQPGARLVPGFVAGKPEAPVSLASFGAAGGLTGTARDLLRFDRALMTGTLLPDATRAEMWRGDPKQGYQAIGQWVFPGALRGCAAPTRIVQRDGEIGGVQTRNYLLPEKDMAVIVFTNRGSDDFAFGEIWQGKGFAYELLSAAACA